MLHKMRRTERSCRVDMLEDRYVFRVPELSGAKIEDDEECERLSHDDQKTVCGNNFSFTVCVPSSRDYACDCVTSAFDNCHSCIGVLS